MTATTLDPRAAFAPAAPPPRDDRVPDLLLERLALGELDAATADRVRDRLAREPGGLARLDALRADDRATLDAHPPARVAAALRARLAADAPAARRAPRWLSPALAAAAAAAIAFVVVSPGADPTAIPDRFVHVEQPPLALPGEPTRSKGLAPSLLAYRPASDGAQRLAPGAALGPGDRLQLAYVAACRRYGVIVSIDGRGAVTLHHPAAPRAPQTLTTSGETPLPFAIELDDAPGFERFFLVAADRPLDVDAVLSAARALASDRDAARASTLPLADDADQTSVLVPKEGRP